MPIKIKSVSTDVNVETKVITPEAIPLNVHPNEFIRKAYSPFVNEETGTWFEYDDKLKAFVDTGVVAKGEKGDKGDDGYTPIKGVDYFDGKNGQDGRDGLDGYTPRKGIDYFDGKDGKNGQNGLNGRDGRDGANGQDGRNGKDGKDGINGLNGYTPIKGIDYFDGKDGKDGINGKDGAKGEDGKDYVITETDYEAIANITKDKVDLTDYVKNTDYANGEKGGVFKVSSTYGTNVSNTGFLKASTITASKYETASENAFVSKSTLDNVLNAKDYATNSDIPTKTSELTNDSNYATTSDIPTKVSELENDLNYSQLEPISSFDIPTYWNTKPTAASSNAQQWQGFFNLKVTPIDPNRAIRVKLGCQAEMPNWTTAKLTEVGLNPADYGNGGEDKCFGYARYRVDLVFIPQPNKTYSVQITDVMYHTSTYRPLYYMNFAYPKTNINDGYIFGWSMYSAYQAYNTTQATFDKLKQVFDRHIVCEIIELENCVYEWVEQKEYLAANFPNHTIGQLGIATQGRTQTGDVNQVDRTTQTIYKTTNGAMCGYNLMFCTNEADKVTQLTTATANSTAQTKTSTSNKINLWKGIYYYSSSTARATNYALAGAALFTIYTSIDLRYSTNCYNNFLINKAGYDVYLIGQFDSNGLFEVKQIPRTIGSKTYNIEVCDETYLPTTNDGYVYVLLGQTVGTNRYSINFYGKHPVFKHNGQYLECIGVC